MEQLLHRLYVLCVATNSVQKLIITKQ